MGRRLFWVVSAAAVVTGFLRAVRLRWICDDAFITFRYADNWISGHGLVYNAGERVEAYTHFLWLCLIALFRRLGSDPVIASECMGLFAFVATLGVYAVISWRIFQKTAPLLPMTVMALVLHYDFTIWATGGLETSLFTLLVATGFLLAAEWRTTHPMRPVLAGLALTLALFTRLDAAIFYFAVLAFILIETHSERPSLRNTLRCFVHFNLATVILFIPYLAWKEFYYGQILPNTYYAKSAGASYYTQGFNYLWLYFRAYVSSLLFIAGIGLILTILLRKQARRLLSDSAERSLLLAVVMVLGYGVFFIARVGGDFMYARFLHPIIPLIYLTIEIVIGHVLVGRKWIRLAALLVIPLMVVYEQSRRDAIYFDKGGEAIARFGPMGVTDEHWYYTRKEKSGRNIIETYEYVGRELGRYFDGTNVKVLLGGQASLGYYARFTYCIDHWGLTDSYVAHLPLVKRSRPGHEKVAPWEYLVRRGVNFEFMKRPYREDLYRSVQFQIGEGTIRAELLTYDRELMRHLRDEFPDKIHFIDFEAYLDDWILAMPGRPIEDTRREYEAFKEFYFLHNQDVEREERIRAYLATRGPDSPVLRENSIGR
jgi:hypothetical protein